MARTPAQNIKQSSRPALVAEMLAWTIVVAVPVVMAAQATHSSAEIRATIVAGFISIIFGARSFIGHGRSVITVTGLFNLSTALFMGFAAITVAIDYSYMVDSKYLALGVISSLGVQVATTALSWGRNVGEKRRLSLAPVREANWITGIGILSLLVITPLHSVASSSMQLFTESAAFTAISVTAAGLIWREGAQVVSWSTMLIVVTLALYAEWFHSGQGRLRIVALACVIAILYSARFQYKWIKYAIVSGVPLALMWLAIDRLQHQESISVGASAGRTGLESMYSSTIVFSQLLQAQDQFNYQLSLGYNLLSFPAIFVPEALWPSKPQALGYELVAIHQPEKYGTGFSVVASSTGEAVYNFGLWGLLLVVPAGALLLRFLDTRLSRGIESMTPTAVGLLVLVFWAMFAGSIADLTWSGQHIFLSRNATRLPLLLGIFLLAAVQTWLANSSGSGHERESSISLSGRRSTGYHRAS